jgi:hypothetical protein
MNNHFIISFEKIKDENLVSYILGFHKHEIKDIAIQFMKLQYKKLESIKFCDEKGAMVAKFINKAGFSLVIENDMLALSKTHIELITSFLLDSTDEYLNYDHIDIEFSEKQIDTCFAII